MITAKILALTLLCFILFQGELSANDNVDPLANFQISKSNIFEGLEQLKKMGKISEADYEKAKKELAGMSDAQVGALTDTAIGMVKKNPDKATELLKKGDKLDAKAVQKQIDELAKPME